MVPIATPIAAPAAVRYERNRRGELVHANVKKLGKVPDGGGWRAYGRKMRSESSSSERLPTAPTTASTVSSGN